MRSGNRFIAETDALPYRLHIERPHFPKPIPCGGEIMNVTDASVDRIKFIEDLLEETREIRTFFAARRNIKKKVKQG